MIEIQGFLLLFLAFFIIFLVRLIKEHRQRAKIARTLKYVIASGAGFCALNLYWLIPTLTARGVILSQLSQADVILFAPRATSRIMFDVASMYGFWRGGYLSPQDMLPVWWLPFLFIMFLVVYGFVGALESYSNRWIATSFGILAVISFLLAVGSATYLTRPLFEWLWIHAVFFRGFRDSHKFVALLCLCYVYLGGLGVNALANVLRTQTRKIVRVALMALLAIAVLTPLGYSFTIFGFYGQLGVTDYPLEWYQVNDYLNQDKGDFNVLFLPWHLYMDFNWLPNSDKRLTNPARQFFDKPIIAGDNIEVTGIYSQSTNPISKYVEFLLINGSRLNNLGELLAPLNVKYVILVHEVDYKLYDFLYQQEDLRVEMEKPGITLLKNEHPTARVYGVDNVIHISSLEEYLELSKEQDVMTHLYIVGGGQGDDGSGQMEKLSFVEKNPALYLIGGTSHNYVIFTVPQNVSTQYWEYDDKKPVSYNLGFMPAFASTADGGEIAYTRYYRTYLPCYVVSVLTLGLMIYLYFCPPKRSSQ
ncbi:hypothetical protein ACFLX0_01360 [Chloroflexota bacterium]